LKVLWDLDGVLVDLLPYWLEVYAALGGEPVRAEAVRDYNFRTQVNNPALLRTALQHGLVLRHAPPMLDVQDMIELVQSWDSVFVTYVPADCPGGYAENIGWLEDYNLASVPRVFTGEKHLVRGDVLVEDSPENLDKWLAANPRGFGIIIDQPYNRQYNNMLVTRVNAGDAGSLGKALTRIERILEETR